MQTSLLASLQDEAGARAFAVRALGLIEEIFPICRSITGDGVRRTLDVLERHLPLQRTEVPSGTPVFDWEVPREWNLRDAYIADASGRRIVDVSANCLHVLGYSIPVRRRMTLAELRPHLFTLPERPDAIPYRTSYWAERWGFCVPQRQLDGLAEGEYEVVIDATLEPGALTYAEARVPGSGTGEFLVFTHSCHPGLANDNASGLAVAALLAQALQQEQPQLNYRFVFAPATIGSITWLAQHADAARALRGGLVIGLLGDPGALSYKRSRRGRTELDLIAAQAVRELDAAARVVDYSPYGYDERQFGSPGFDLPVGRLTRSSNGEYPQYHTSDDNLSLMSVAALTQSVQALARILARVDGNCRLRSTSPFGEPRLGKRGLFRSTGGSHPAEFEYALLWLLNQADGTHGLDDVSAASGLPVALVRQAAQALLDCGLVTPVDRWTIGSEQSTGQEGSR